VIRKAHQRKEALEEFMIKFFMLGLLAFGSITFGPHKANAQFEASAADLSKYNYVDPGNIVPDVPLRRALTYYDVYYNQLRNRDYITVVDMTKKNTQKRMFLIDMKTGKVSTYLVAHGMGSDPSHTGMATKFSNTPGSNMTSMGLYVTGSQYSGSHGKSLRLNGLEATNSNAFDRAIVIHGAWYVDPQYNPLGRSNGCPAVEQRYVSSIVDRLKDGSVYYIWAGK
jgi:hypothetical protein